MADNPFADLVPAPAPQQAKANPFADLVPARAASTAPKSVGAALKHGLLEEPYQDVRERTSEAQAALVHDLTTKPEMSPVGLAGRAAKTGLDVMGGAWSPIQGGIDYLFGRPVSDLTGNRISKETAGDVAGLVVPIGLEAKAAQAAGKAPILAKEASAFAKGKTSPVLSKVLASAPKDLRHPILAKNVAGLEAAGITPSLALASPSRTVRGLTQTLGHNTLVGGPIRKRIADSYDEFHTALQKEVGQEPLSAARAGEGIKRSIAATATLPNAVRQAIGATPPAGIAQTVKIARSTPSRDLGMATKATQLYAHADNLIGKSGQTISMPHTTAAIQEVLSRFDNPELRERFASDELRHTLETLERSNGKLTWNDARQLRSNIGRALDDPQVRVKLPEAEKKAIYAALSRDQQVGALKLGGPSAQKAFQDADKFYSAFNSRVESALSPYYGKNATGSEVFHDMVKMAQEGGKEDFRRLLQVKRSVPADVWHDLQTSVFDSMGRANPGQRTMDTDWSFRTFLTNFQKLNTRAAKASSGTDTGLKVMFTNAKGDDRLKNLEKLATAVSRMKELDKFTNHSQSGRVAADTITGVEAARGIFDGKILGTIMPLMGGHAVASAIANPDFVRWLANLPEKGDPAALGKKVGELGRMAKDDPSLRPVYASVLANVDRLSNVNQQPLQP